MRLAGLISYPIPIKLARGYVTELTRLDLTNGGEVCRDSFIATYPQIDPPPKAKPEPSQTTCTAYGTSDSDVPLKIIEAALRAIPAIRGDKRRGEWLHIVYACKEANPNCAKELDAWQSLSDRYDRINDPHIFDQIPDAPALIAPSYSRRRNSMIQTGGDMIQR